MCTETNPFEHLPDLEAPSLAEKAALLQEVILLAEQGQIDPLDIHSIYETDSIPSIERGTQIHAEHRATFDTITAKVDHHELQDVLYSNEPTHIAELEIGDTRYSFFVSSEEYHDEDDSADSLVQFWKGIERAGSNDDVAQLRARDLAGLPDDFKVDIYENLPKPSYIKRSIAQIALDFANLTTDPEMILNAQQLRQEAIRDDETTRLELSINAQPLDAAAVRQLTESLRRDYKPIIRP